MNKEIKHIIKDKNAKVTDRVIRFEDSVFFNRNNLEKSREEIEISDGKNSFVIVLVKEDEVN